MFPQVRLGLRVGKQLAQPADVPPDQVRVQARVLALAPRVSKSLPFRASGEATGEGGGGAHRVALLQDRHLEEPVAASELTWAILPNRSRVSSLTGCLGSVKSCAQTAKRERQYAAKDEERSADEKSTGRGTHPQGTLDIVSEHPQAVLLDEALVL